MPAVDVLPVELIPRVVHGEQDFHFHRPIRPGDKLVSRGKMIGYEGLENGTRAAIKLECRTEDGELVNEQYVTTFVRGFNAGKSIGVLEPGPQVRRDACARRNPSPPSCSTSTRTRRSGTRRLPAIRCRSTSTRRSPRAPGCRASSPTGCAPWPSRRGRCSPRSPDSDVSRLKRFAVRFSKMVIPGDDLETRIWKKGSARRRDDLRVRDHQGR